MPHPALLGAMQRQPAFRRLLDRLPESGTERTLAGLPGSSKALLVAALAADAPGRLWVVVAPDPAAADSIEADLGALYDPDRVQLYPQREALPYEAEDHHLEIGGLRVEALEALLSGRTRVLVTPRRALQELADIPDRLAELRLTLAVGDAVRPRDLADRLDSLGFRRVPLVEGVGEYALRGGILDLFGFGAADPVRIEFWGDEISSLRRFDILDQRSTAEIDRVDVLPVDFQAAADAGGNGGPASPSAPRSLLDVLPREAVLVDLDPDGAAPSFARTWDELLRMHDAERKRGRDPVAPSTRFLPPDALGERLRAFGRLAVGAASDADVRFRARPAERVDRDMDRLSALLRTGAARGEDTLLLCDNRGQLERLEELLGGPDALPPRATTALGTVAEGFVLEGADPPLRVLTDHEIFRRARRIRRRRRFRGAVSLESLAQLKPGDYVVHLDHGVGRFRGLERVRVGEEEVESLAIEYAGGEILRVPVYRLDLIERWVPGGGGGDGDGATKAPRIHKIGGKSWKKTRRKTERAIREMATELLELYAARQVARGHAASPDTRWQKEMEAAFLYDDTPDQRVATADVKRDMESPRPMDRLLCGDVGYGKTEVAVRAAFKMVQDGKQVAVLAPTTILV
ncbi:MAG: CarD family transcriptional regulator, partial [Gemmatimonadota bacterium]